MDTAPSSASHAPSDSEIGFRLFDTYASRLWDFGTFDLTRFRVVGPSDDRADALRVLDAFRKDRMFRRQMSTWPDRWGAHCDNHGPFIVDALSADCFRPITHDELAERVSVVLGDPSFTQPPSAEQQAPVVAWMRVVRARSDAVYHLQSPPKAHWEHAGTWLLFEEFLSLSPDGSLLTVAVLLYD